MTTGTQEISIVGSAIGAVAIVLFQYLGIPQTAFTMLAALLTIDFFTGGLKQYYLDPHGITSYSATKGLIKKLLIATLVVVFALGMHGVGLDPATFLMAILSLFIATEVYSTTQNVYVIITGESLPEFDVMKIVLGGVMVFLRRKIEVAVKDNLTEPSEK